MRPALFLPSGYNKRKHRTVEGVARTGEVSPQGTVAHTEDWDGRVAADVRLVTMRYEYSKSTGRIRQLSFKELVDRGYFILGKGPN